jgi:hypothetical protein
MPTWVFLALLALEVPAVVALADCYERPLTDFPGGEDDKHGWKVWLWIALATAWIFGVGNIIVLGYHSSIVKRSTPLGRG